MYGILITAVILSVTVYGEGVVETCTGIVPMKERYDRINITEYGGVGDGVTVNTKAFREAIYRIQHLRRRGGSVLYVPPGVWLTDRFNLTSHMTLYLAAGAVLKATQDTSNWPLADPLPSYGRGRELPGGRYMSFILGDGVQDVIITGENGTIDGQGDVWWNMWRQRTLLYTRPHLIEFMNSKDIIISNVILKNSPFWNVHPVYCSNFVVQYATILAPADSPNTDGIDPDSSSNVCIEDSYISTGDDLVAIKSGWDEYGIAYGRPSSYITIRRVTGSTPFAGIAIGSETSGGVENILAEHINLFGVGVGIHVKTNTGRGGYIKNITFSNIYMENARKGIKIAGDVGGHPDERFNPNANPVVEDIIVKNIWGQKVQQPGLIRGIKNAPFTNICLSDINLYGTKVKTIPWECSDVKGSSLKAIFCYWVTSNIFSFAYGSALKMPGVKAALKIPEIPVPPPSATKENPQSGFSFFQAMKQVSQATQNAAEVRQQSSPTGPKASSSAVLKQRIKSLERQVKQRSKNKKH